MKFFRSLLFLAVAGLALNAQDASLGTVTGTVFDASTGQPIRSAKVEIDGNSDKRMVSDLDGRYKIEISPGKYKLRFTAENYSETTVDEVVVVGGQIVEASTVLSNKANVTTLDVVEKVGAVAATAEAALSERKLAGAVSDTISNEEIRSGIASTAAGALEKVTGVSIVEGGYVYVRGLGERYSATMLNNALIPTTEPEKRVVPLDLFPASLIDNVKILKTYTPDLPGEFSGGLVQMSTVDFPSAKTFKFGISTGFNTQTSFNAFSSHLGSNTDFLGFDRGSRSMPSAIPEDKRLFPGNFTEQQFTDFGRSFQNNWEDTPIETMRPTQSYNMVGGGTYGRYGIVGAISFNNKPQRFNETQNYYRNAGNNIPILFTNYDDFRSNNESARLGGVFNVAAKLNATNKITLRNTLTRDTDKETRFFSGYAGTIDSFVTDERIRYIERSVLASSLEGEHAVAKLWNSLFRWQFTYSRSTRDEPDLREVVRGRDETGKYVFLARPESGLRFFNELADDIYEPQLDWSKPFYRGPISGIFKTGFRATLRRRDFVGRRFRFVPGRETTAILGLPSNELFAPENIGPNKFQIREVTRGTDTYNASMDVYGFFGMVDMALGTKWRLVGGVRFEDADINVITQDPLIAGQPSIANLKNRDPLPGVNLIYQLTGRQNLRFGYSRTLSRPDFRELSPFEFTNVVGGYSTLGNPNLRRAVIDNFDARWEYFPGGSQIIAASYFFKDFTDPIETTIRATADIRQTFLNAEGARNQGVELEYRRSLGFLNPRFSQFVVGANATIVDSQVQIPKDEAVLLTSTSRPLVGQSRYIFNIISEWARPQWHSSARFFVNSVSRRITDVGTFGLPDIYQERNTFMDFVYQYDIGEKGRWSIRFAAENLTDNRYHWTQANLLQRDYRLGRNFNIGTSFSVF